MTHLTNTDWTTAVEQERGGGVGGAAQLAERGVQKGYEYQALCVCVDVILDASPAS